MNILKSISLILLLIIQSGCIPALFVVGGGAVGKTAMEERSVGNAVDDITVWTRIKNAFISDKNGQALFLKIGVKVLEGRVLLTGILDNPEDRVDAIKTVWSQDGVREVINEIKLSSETEDSLKNIATDSWITAQIKSKIILEDKVKSVNYSIETINGVVYLMGIAQDEGELDLVTEIAGTTKNVERVISYVRVKTSPIRQQMLKNNR